MRGLRLEPDLYEVAPSTGVQRTRPGTSGRCSGAPPPLHVEPERGAPDVMPLAVWARTRAYSAYGLPVIHGSEIGIVDRRNLERGRAESVDQTSVLSSNVLLVASWKS